MDEIIKRDCEEILSRVDLEKARNKRILVTGANGFLGQYIVAVFSEANFKFDLRCKIHAVSLNKPRSVLSSLLSSDKNIFFEQVDLTKDFNLKGYDYIFHAAGYGQPAKFTHDFAGTIGINVDATRHLIESNPQAIFVLFSSAEIYGDIPRKFIPVNEGYNGNCFLHRPRSVYGESKRLAEALCATCASIIKGKIKIVRISHTYGPGLPFDDTRVMSEFIKKALIQKKIALLDSGSSVKTYGYIGDTISMIVSVALHGKELVYNVGGKDSISILNLAKKIAHYCEANFSIPKKGSHLKHIGKDPTVVKLDLSKIKGEMKNLILTPFNEGLMRTIEWTKRQNMLSWLDI